jgi:hypothetical protein
MSMDDRDDPSADTAMFRAYVDGGNEPPAAGPAAGNRTLRLAIAAVAAVVVLVAIIVMAS